MSANYELAVVPDTMPPKKSLAELGECESSDHVTANAVLKRTKGVVTLFSRFAPDDLIDEKTLAEGFDTSGRTIRRRVKAHILPPCDPGLKMWRVGNIKAWLDARAKQTEETSWNYWLELKKLKK